MDHPWKIGVILESLGLGVQPGMRKAAELGLDGFQVYVTKGEMYPDNLSAEQRRAFRQTARSLGLEISALCGDFDWVRGFTDAEFNRMNIPRIRKCIDLAVDLETPVVTMQVTGPEKAAASASPIRVSSPRSSSFVTSPRSRRTPAGRSCTCRTIGPGQWWRSTRTGTTCRPLASSFTAARATRRSRPAR